MYRRLVASGIAGCLCLLGFDGSVAGVVRVPADRPTILDAVVATGPGDTVLVAPGSHPIEQVILIWDHPRVILSEAGPELTRIYGPTNPSPIMPYLFWIGPPGESATVIEGFTVAVQFDNGGIRCDVEGGRTIIRNNVVSAQICILISSFTEVEVAGNTLLAHDRGIYHGSCLHLDRAQVVATNNLMVGGDYGVVCGPNADLTMSCNNVWDHDIGDYIGQCEDQTGLNGNISEDPLFCDRWTDHYLRSDSPCLDGYGCGRMGALGIDCEPTATEGITWGTLRRWCR